MNQQQQLVNGMPNKTNLLSMLRTCSVFMDTDGGPRIKVVCRYQQFRAANKIIERLRNGQTAEEKSGVVWHTQGSGKSLTMVFVARMLRASGDLNDYKILLVAIGMPVTRHPSHRSQRALLMHWAPALGSGGKAIERQVMTYSNWWGIAFPQLSKPLPRHALTLTSSS